MIPSTVRRHLTSAKAGPLTYNVIITQRFCSKHAAIQRTANDVDSHQQVATRAKAVIDPPKPPADHRLLAIDQELFTTSKYSPGSPLFLPNGTRIFNRLTAFLRRLYEHTGFQEVITPTIYKRRLWEKGGHWENYAADMFAVTGHDASKITQQGDESVAAEEAEFGLKPMNCPGHCILFASERRSYRDLPIRYADFSPLHRNEASGTLSGLTRVRRFHQDDGHIFCRPSQVKDEIKATLDFVKVAYETFNLGPYRLALSTRPAESFIGSDEEWNRAESALREALEASGQPWTINPGDGAFYGPKIDIILKDSDGKEHQTATVQLDFQLPKRFDLSYVAPAEDLDAHSETATTRTTADEPDELASKGLLRPVMIHRAVLGSIERFMALLIEHYDGKWPFWLNPRQIMICTVSDAPAIVTYANDIRDELQGTTRDHARGGVPRVPYFREGGFAIEIDARPLSVSKKIAQAKSKRYSIIVTVGNKNLGVVAAENRRPIETGETQTQQEAVRSANTNTLNVDLSGLRDPVADYETATASTLEQSGANRKLRNMEMDIVSFRALLGSLERHYR